MNHFPNLETLELKTLQILQDQDRPLISLKNLLRHLNDVEAFASLNEATLIEFIDDHELFCLTRPSEDAPEFLEPAVYLSSRVPSNTEIKAHMALELDAMIQALEAAKREADTDNDGPRTNQITQLLERAHRLRNAIPHAK